MQFLSVTEPLRRFPVSVFGAAALLALPLMLAAGPAGAVTRGCSATVHVSPTNFSGVAITRPFRAEANALGPNTARRHAYEKLITCVTQHWGRAGTVWPVSCRPAAMVYDYPFRQIDRDIPAALCAANPGHSRILAHVWVAISGNTGCSNPDGVNDWGITELQAAYPVNCGDVVSHTEGTDRPGMDYRNLNLPVADWRTCYQACAADSRCQAWTYVAPNSGQGASARCWLKDGVPPARAASCCVSGVMGRGLD